MGLDASVRCRCWEQGVVPADLQPYIRLDDEHYLEFTLPFDGNEALARRYYEWEQHGCPHPNMEQAAESLSNWGGYRQFQRALDELGGERFPVLLRELPEANGGHTDASAARLMLAELEAFCSAPPFGTRIVLVDSDTGSEVQESIDAYGGAFVIGPDGFRMGVDRDGFFIAAEHGAPLFRSMRFTQQLHDPAPTAHSGGTPATYRDLDSGQSHTCESAVSEGPLRWPDGMLQNAAGKLLYRYPARMHVERRRRGPQRYAYITTPLKIICEASIATGNPIRWC